MSKTNMVLQFMLNQIRGHSRHRSNSRRFQNYYMSNQEDKKGNAAKVIDFIIVRVFGFFTIFIMMFLQLRDLIGAILVTLVFLSIFHQLSIKYRNRRLEIKKKQSRRLIASEKILNEIMNNTIEELKTYIVEIFKKTGFANFNHRWSDHKLITYDAIYNQEKILMSTYIHKTDLYVELKELKEFFYQLREEDIEKGILMTTSDFTKDCYEYVEKLDSKYKITLLNKDMMLRLIEKNSMFPTEDEIDELVENKISRKETLWEKHKLTILANKKAKSYFLLSIFLLVSANYTPYPIYYTVVAGGTLLMTIGTLALRVANKRNIDQEGWDQFNKMLKEL